MIRCGESKKELREIRESDFPQFLRVSKKSLFSLDESGDFGMKMGKK